MLLIISCNYLTGGLINTFYRATIPESTGRTHNNSTGYAENNDEDRKIANFTNPHSLSLLLAGTMTNWQNACALVAIMPCG